MNVENPIVAFKGNITRLMGAQDFILPSNIKPEAFRNAAVVAATDNPKILECETNSVMKSLRKLASDGLVPDGREAALVPFWDNKARHNKCQAMPMVYGLIKTARNSGELKDIRAHIVYQNEYDDGRFVYSLGDEESIVHEPIVFGPKGDPIGAYAVAILKDGTIVREFMDHEQIEKVRRSAASQKIYEKGKKPQVSETPLGIWFDWWEEMWKKTVIRRLAKRLPLSSEDLRKVVAGEDDLAEMKDVTPQEPKTLQEKLQDAAGQEDQTPEVEPEDVSQDEDEPTEEVEEAEIIEDKPKEEEEAPAPAGKGDDDAELSPFPGSNEYNEGAKAFSQKMGRDKCLYDAGTQAQVDWCAGWDWAKDQSK